jgi:hypothetical protein
MNLKSEIGQMNPDLWRFGQIKTPSGLLKHPACPPRSLFYAPSASSVNSVLIPILWKLDCDH